MELKTFDPCGERFARMGRHDPDETVCHLWWSGSGIRMNIACRTLEVEAESTAHDHAPWLAVLVDGAPVARIPLTMGVRRYPVLVGLDGSVTHEVIIARDTQPSYDESGAVLLRAVLTDGEPAMPAPRPRRLEFLGDSLTVGEGCLGPESADEWRMPWISHHTAFPTLVAEALHAEKRICALGGWGASRSWDNDENSRIGRIYDQLCGVTPGGDVPYAEPDQKTDAVIINLGTNDGSALAKMTAEERQAAERKLRERAVELLTQVRARHPEALILWAYGLCGHQVEPVLQEAVVARRQAGDERVRYLSLTPAMSNGSRMHPSREAHRLAAREIIAALKEGGVA